MADNIQDESADIEETELAEDVKDALAVLEEEEESSDIRELLSSPTARHTVERMVMTAVSVIEERHSGPLPAPRQMREYEEIVPGGAERIFKMAEREQLHRHGAQKSNVDFRDRAFSHVQGRENKGQLIALGLCCAILAIGLYLIILGHPSHGTGLIIATLVGIASVFAIRKTTKTKPPIDPPTDE